MKRLAKSLMPRLLIVFTLAAAFIVNPGLRTAAVMNTSAPIAAKTEAQFKDEAARYERALLAISKISSATLDTPEALQQALELFKQQRTNIGFHRSKLIARAISDPTLLAAIKRTATDAKSAQQLLQEIISDRFAVLRLNGAKGLVPVLDDMRRNDASVLKAAGERLKISAGKFNASGDDSVPTTNGFRIVHAGYRVALPAGNEGASVIAPVDPVTIVGAIAIAVGAVVAAVFIATAIQNLYDNLFTEEGRDAVVECQRQADDSLQVCLTSAGRLDGLAKTLAEAVCAAEWLINQSQCLIKA